MLLAGDEFGRSQMGNNNGYCQDSELSWVHWENLPESADQLRKFVTRLIALRGDNPILRRESWRDGTSVTWLNPSGGEQTQQQWEDEGGTTIGLRLTTERPDAEGMNDVLVLFNPHNGDIEFKLPVSPDKGWVVELTTDDPETQGEEIGGAQFYGMKARSLVVLTAGS